MEFSGNKTISRDLTLLVVLSLLPVLFILLYSGLSQKRASIEIAKNNMLFLTHTLANAQKDITHSARQLLSTLARLHEIKEIDLKSARNIFEAVLKENPEFLNITLTGLDGEVLAAGKPFKPGTNLADRKHFREALKTKDFAIGEFILGRLGPATPAFAFAYPVLDGDGNILALLTAAMKLSHFSYYHEAFKLPENAFVSVTDHKGVRLFYYPPKEATNPVGEPIKLSAWEIADKSKEPGHFVGKGGDGISRIFAFEQVSSSIGEKPYIYVWAGIPEAFIAASADAAQKRNLLLLFLATLLSLFLAWYLGRKTMIAPIRNLVNMTGKFAQGNLDTRFVNNNLRGEFAVLGESFGSMAGSIKTQISKLKESEERYHSLFYNSQSVMVIIDPETFYIVEANPAACEFYGYSHDDLVKMKIFSINLLPKEELRKEMNKARISKKSHFYFQHRLKDGTVRDVETYSSPIIMAGKERLYTIIHDISKQKKLEEELFQVYKMEAIGTLAGGIAHDFNNILSAIMGYSEIIRIEGDKADDLQANISEVLKAGERAKKLVSQILTFSRKNKMSLKPMLPQPVVKEALKMLRSSIPSAISIEQDIAADCGSIMADATQFHQIIVNLCTNSFQAMENKKGTLFVSLYSQIVSQDDLSDSEVLPGKFVVLEVRDTGEGIEQKLIDKIFEPYFTTKEKCKGTGLGLSVIHGIVKDYHGFVKVESELGKGSTFKIYIPAIKNVSDKGEEEKPLKNLPVGHENILVVDDEKAIALVLESHLGKLGYHVTSSSSSKDALELVRSEPGKFDLIITDLTMPHYSGIELAQEVNKIRPEIHFIVCSGYNVGDSEESIHGTSIRGFLSKPVNIDELSAKIRAALKG